MNFVAIDFETANASRDSACSLGMVKVINGKITEEWYALIKPPTMQFDYRNIAIHGILPKDVEGMPDFKEHWPSIQAFIGELPLIAHNASFDFSVLRYCFDTYQIPYPTLNYYCTVIASKKTWPKLSGHDLYTVSSHLGLRFKHHDALEDARTCAKVFIAACEEQQASSIEEFCEKSGSCSGRIFERGYTPASVKKKVQKKA